MSLEVEDVKNVPKKNSIQEQLFNSIQNYSFIPEGQLVSQHMKKTINDTNDI